MMDLRLLLLSQMFGGRSGEIWCMETGKSGLFGALVQWRRWIYLFFGLLLLINE